MLSGDMAAAMIQNILSSTKYEATIQIEDTNVAVTRFANSEINQNISIEDTKIILTLHDGQKEAAGSTNTCDADGLQKLVRDTENILAIIPAGEFGFFDCDGPPVNEAIPDTRLADVFDINGRAAILAENVRKIPRGYTIAGALSLKQRAAAFGNSRGAFRYAAFDCVAFNAVARHHSGASGGGECISYRFDGLDIGAAFDAAYGKAARARNPVTAKPGVYTVVLSPVAVGDMMSYIAYPHCAKWIDDGDSYAIGKMGQKVFCDNITLWDDAGNKDTQPLYFDCEGNRRKSLPLIDKGVPISLLHDNKTAKRHGAVVTGHATSRPGHGGYPQNLVMSKGNSSLDEMIAGTKKGIFITEFHYTNYVNPRLLQITGLTRNGTFMIENGSVTKAVSTLRFTQSCIDALNRVTALGSRLTKVNVDGNVALMPAMMIEGWSFNQNC